MLQSTFATEHIVYSALRCTAQCGNTNELLFVFAALHRAPEDRGIHVSNLLKQTREETFTWQVVVWVLFLIIITNIHVCDVM